MANNPGISEVVDKDGVTADIEAKRFDGTRTVNLQGDVSGTQTWNGDSSTALTINASIGAKKVTQDKIGDKAVGSGQMADGSVGLTQIAASAMTDTVAANNSKLITSQGVNAAIAAATLNRGKDYGPMSVDEINAISETIPTGSTVYVEHLGAGNAKVINDGYSDGTMASFSVEVGEDLKYYRAPDNSLHGWHSTEANVKIKQPANYSGGIAVDSAQDASSGSAGIEFIQSFKQNTNGDIADIVKAQVDIVDSISSTRMNAAATPNSVKSAYDLANGKYSKPSGGIPKSDLASGVQTSLDKADSALQPTGDGKDLTSTVSTENNYTNPGSTATALKTLFGKIWNFIGRLRTSWQTTPDDSHFPSEKLVKDSLDAKADANNSVTIYDASVARINTSGNSWYKIAEVPLKNGLQFRNAVWDVFANVNDDPGVYRGRLILKSQSSSSAVSYADATLYADAWNRDVFDFKTVAKTTLNDGYVQIWAKVASGISSLSISERFLFGVTYKPRHKGLFTYTSYDSVAGSAEPQTDAQNNIVANPARLIYRKHTQAAVTDPTASGTALSFIDSIAQNENGEITPTKKSVTVDSTPTAGSSNPVSSGGVKDSLDAISTAAGAEAEVTAAALDDLDARMRSVEEAVNSDNIGDKTADSFDAQVLKIGGENLDDLLGGKVDKEAGKGLSTNDFTDAYKSNVDANTQARHSHSNKTVLDGISSSDIDNWNAKQAALDFMTDTDVDNLFTAAWNAANS